MNINTVISVVDSIFAKYDSSSSTAQLIKRDITNSISSHDLDVADRVLLSNHILSKFSEDQRIELCRLLLKEQVADQRKELNGWMTITGQSSQIDTGYIAQHLVSLRTKLSGQGMRGKGDDLCDGSEVKSANFLDSLDKRGATAPRWNFTAVTSDIMMRFLKYDPLYLLSMDLDPNGQIRIRIWTCSVPNNPVILKRYYEWMDLKGKPKFASHNQESVNFQLFPPHSGTEEDFARHGSNRNGELPPIDIPLNDGVSTKLIFLALQNGNDFAVNFY